MKPVDPRAERMREALDLVLANLKDELGRLRARVTTLVASLAAEAQVLSERCKCDGADAVETAMAEMRVAVIARFNYRKSRPVGRDPDAIMT